MTGCRPREQEMGYYISELPDRASGAATALGNDFAMWCLTAELAKLMANNAMLCSEVTRQAVQVANSQQVAAEAASRWAGQAGSDVVPDHFMAETDVETVNQWVCRLRDMVDIFVWHLKQYFTRTSM